VLTTGAAHLCLNADQPVARLAAQLDSAGARVVVASTAFQSLAHELVGGTGGEVVVVAIEGDERTEPPVVELDPADLAYVISTSGTSGTPKAVAVTHGGLRNYTEHIAGLIDGATGDAGPLSFGVVTSLSTDLANTCLYPALALGGCVHLVPHDDVMDPDRFAAYVARHPLDILKIAPSHLTALLAAGGGVLPSRILFTGGEVATWTLYQRVQELGTCRIFNHYGPSETTVGSLVFDVDGAQASDRTRPSVPIGLPLANTRVVLVDDRHRPVFPGAVGQIAIGGHGLARGYLGDPDRTRESFVDDPTDPGVRVYLTGDQGRRLPSGAVEFLGRLDGQVKVRGYRVETAEVEDALRLHPEVSRAAVIVREDRIDDQRLVAYVVSPYSHAPAPAELRAHLAERLPGYMVPSAFVAMSTLPLTANGKLDRSALPPPGLDDVDGQSEFIEPSTASEQMVAEIFADLLLVEQVGAEDDFFALGGHSLLATQAVARIRKATGVSLQVHQLFNEPTVRGLAGVVDTLLVTVDDADDAELRALLSELEDLTDEEAEALLAAESDGDAVT
jgi:amino acid adenylation domain-containing protein